MVADHFLAPGATAGGSAGLGLLSSSTSLDSKTQIGRGVERAGLARIDFTPFQTVGGAGGSSAVGVVVEAGGRGPGPGVRANASQWISPGKAHVTPGMQTLGYTRAAQGALVVRHAAPGHGDSPFAHMGAAATAQRVGGGMSLRGRIGGGGWGEPSAGFGGGLAAGMNNAFRQQVGPSRRHGCVSASA